MHRAMRGFFPIVTVDGEILELLMADGYLVEIKSRSLNLTSAYTNINCCVIKFFSPRGGGYSPIKVTGLLVGNFREHP